MHLHHLLPHLHRCRGMHLCDLLLVLETVFCGVSLVGLNCWLASCRLRCCRWPNRRPCPPRETKSAISPSVFCASSHASAVGFLLSFAVLLRWKRQPHLFTRNAKCACTIFSSSKGSVRFTKTDGSLTTRGAPPWRCPRTSSPTLGNALLAAVQHCVWLFVRSHVSGVSLASDFFSRRSRKKSQEPARRLRATLNPKRVVFGWPWGGLVCN